MTAAGHSRAVVVTAKTVSANGTASTSLVHAHAGTRLALLDAMRVVAAIGIIWVHAAQSAAGKQLNPIGTFGVPFYTYLAVLFMARGLTRTDQQRSLGVYILSRLYRVYLPFLFWSAIYLALQETKGFLETHHLPNLHWHVLYYGGHEHLWFLPYLLVVTVVGAILVCLLHDRPRARRTVSIVLVLLGVASCFWKQPAWIEARIDDVEFWRYAFRAMPTVFFSIALALETASRGTLPRSTPQVATGGLFLVLLALMLQVSEGPLKALRTCAGFGVLLIALLPIHAPFWERVGRLGRYSYGIYLSHLLFIRIVVLWMHRYEVRPSLTLDVLTFVFAFVSASVLSVLMSQSKYTRWALGE